MKVIYVDLGPYYGLLQVAGADAASFLQGQLSCDIHSVLSHEFQLGGHCNLKGRLRTLFRIYKQNDSFYLQAPLGILDYAAEELKKYARFSKVSITNISSSQAIIGLIGIENLEQFLFATPLAPDTYIIKVPHSKTRYEIIGSKESQANFLNHASQTLSAQNFEFWKLSDIQDGLPEVWPELREQLLPHHIQLPKLGGVSFTKGCYCGQEIIARMEYRGNIKKTMIRGKIEPAVNITPGTCFYLEDSNTEIGMVITVASINKECSEILLEISEAYMPKDEIPSSVNVYANSVENPMQLSLFPHLWK